jgi:hypothetical protein
LLFPELGRRGVKIAKKNTLSHAGGLNLRGPTLDATALSAAQSKFCGWPRLKRVMKQLVLMPRWHFH